MHSPDWQPSCHLERRGTLVDKAVDCHSIDLDETERYLNAFKQQPQQYAASYGAYDPLDDFSQIDDDHVYHELEVCLTEQFEKHGNTLCFQSLHRISLLFNDNASFGEVSHLTSPTTIVSKPSARERSPSRCSSPIYAVPYEGTSSSSSSDTSPRNDNTPSVCGGYRRVKRIQREKSGPAPFPLVDDSYGPLEIASPFYASSLRRTHRAAAPESTYASSRGQDAAYGGYEHYSMPPQLHIPPPPPHESAGYVQSNAYRHQSAKSNELDFLAELDQQIAELQVHPSLVVNVRTIIK